MQFGAGGGSKPAFIGGASGLGPGGLGAKSAGMMGALGGVGPKPGAGGGFVYGAAS